ncbi:THO2 plays a role in transcriptional elongation [Cryptotrichosporon argae]
MPPRKSKAKAAQPVVVSASADAADLLDDAATIGRVEAAIARWNEGGKDDVATHLKSLVETASSTSLSTIPLSHVLLSLFTSPLEQQSLVDLFTATLSGNALGEDALSMFAETLVDLVEVLEESREDCEDIKPSSEGMDVDGAEAAPLPAAKAMGVVKALMESNALPSHIPNLLFSPNQLLALGLHPTPGRPDMLPRQSVKRSTAIFYKQAKYNLLRESSEGFSRLIVLLTGPDALISSPRAEADAARPARARRVWASVMSLIGYFNLSPPRVLDIILEIASCHVAAHWRFFLDVLRCSPWGEKAAQFEGKGKQRAAPDADVEAIVGAIRDGDRVLAQVIGFKFGFYQRADGGDTPIGLVYVAALLVKHGFVSLADLLPFLTPDDAEMANIHSRYLASVSSRSGPSNALANSVLLDDDGPSSSSGDAANASGPPPKPPPEQRIQLAQALLSIGDQGAALFLIARHPWIAQSHPAIADLILRNVGHALEPVYRAHVAGHSQDENEETETVAPTHSAIASKEVVPTLLSPVPPATSMRSFEFFYSDWVDDVEVWSTSADVYQKGLKWLGLVRGLGGRAVPVMIKICRLAKQHFADLRHAKAAALGLEKGLRTREELVQLEPTMEEMEPWLHVLRVSVLPSLCVSSKTAPFDVELWELLRHFPYPVRYCLYGEWRDSTCNFRGRNPCPAAAAAAAECTREIKKALSRVTASQSGPSSGTASQAAERGPARSLAKLSHSNPCALWTTAVNQVKAYTNIGQFIVEAGRYMTQLSMDVAIFTLVDTLSDDNASRLNPQGTGVAQWLESLATFVGDFNRRYANMDLEPVLQFVINRLARGESADLTILGSLVSVMSGQSVVLNFAVSDEQLEAHAGGREIIREAFYTTQLAVARPAEGDGANRPKEAPVEKTKSTKKSLPRLVNALRDTRLAIPIWVALAQTTQGAVDRMPNAPLKAMEITQDSCHDIFIQYGDLLSEQLTPDEHIALTPDLTALVSDFGLDYANAFQILRARLNAALEKTREEDKANIQNRLKTEKEKLGSPIQAETPLPPSTPMTPMSMSGDMEVEGDDDVKADDGAISTVPVPKTSTGRPKTWWPSALEKTMRQARALLPQHVNSVLGAPFFVIFWQLHVSDIAFSPESYSKAIERITRLESDLASWKTANLPDNRIERARLRARIEQLAKERDAQQAFVVGPMRRRLRLESARWFGKTIVALAAQRTLAIQLHQYCFYPRAVMTPADAAFVAKFIRLAHELGTIGFSTVFAINNFFNDQLAACIFSCTESEARNLGRCLAGIMAWLDTWHADEKVYRLEALGLPDEDKSKIVTDDAPKPKGLPGMYFRRQKNEDLQPMSWVQFRNLYAKLHNNLNRALLSCWQEPDFMHTKNAITVGLQVIKSFPVMETNGKAIEAVVNELMTGRGGTVTGDVQALSKSYSFHLKKRQQSKPFISPHLFHSSGARPPAPTPATLAKGAPASASTKLNRASPAPAAPDEAKTEAPKVEEPARTDTKQTDVPLPLPPRPSTLADAKALRQKLEEGRQRSASAKEERPTPSAPATSVASMERARIASPAPPAGPRATRSSAAAPGTASPAPSAPAARNGPPTGPSKATPTGSAAASVAPAAPGSMGPPKELTVDEARAAARARKFGAMTGAAPPPPAPREPQSAHARSPTPTRRESLKREGSVESRTSERSRRDRDRRDDDRDRDRERRDRDDRERRGRDRRDEPPNRERERDRDGRGRSGKDGKDEDKREVPDRENGTTSRAESRTSEGRHDRDRRERDERDRERDSRRRDDGKRKRDDDDRRDREKRAEREHRDRRDERDERDDKDRSDRHRRDRERDERDRDGTRGGERDDREAGRRRDKDGGRDRDRDRDTRDGKDKDARDPRDARDARGGRNAGDGRDGRDVRDGRDGSVRDRRDLRDERDRPRDDRRDKPEAVAEAKGAEPKKSPKPSEPEHGATRTEAPAAGRQQERPHSKAETRAEEKESAPESTGRPSNGQAKRIVEAPRGRLEPPRRPDMHPHSESGIARVQHALPARPAPKAPAAARERADPQATPPTIHAERPTAAEPRAPRSPEKRTGAELLPVRGGGTRDSPVVQPMRERPDAPARQQGMSIRSARTEPMSIRSAESRDREREREPPAGKTLSLAARMGIQTPGARGTPPHMGTPESSATPGERKRPLEDAATSHRDESPGASKRPKTARERGVGGGGGGRRESGGGSGSGLFGRAMQAASSDGKP